MRTTGMRSVILLLLLAGVALLFLSPAEAGDPEAAKLFLRKADKAFRSKDYTEATKFYRRALGENTPYPEAAYGLGQALEKLGRKHAALQAYLDCKKQAEGMERLSSKARSCLRKAKKRIGALGKAYAEASEIEAAFTRQLIAFGKKHTNGAPMWAKQAFLAANRLAPGDEKVKKYLEKLSHVEGPSGGFGLPQQLVKGDSLSGWDAGPMSGCWSSRGQMIIGDQTQPGTILYRSGLSLAGRYRLTASFRVVDRHGPDWYYGFLFGVADGGGRMFSLCYGFTRHAYMLRAAAGERDEVGSKLLSKWDPTEWHTLRVDVEPTKVTAFADDEEVFSHEVKDPRTLEGTIALTLRDAKIEIKDVKVYR